MIFREEIKRKWRRKSKKDILKKYIPTNLLSEGSVLKIHSYKTLVIGKRKNIYRQSMLFILIPQPSIIWNISSSNLYQTLTSTSTPVNSKPSRRSWMPKPYFSRWHCNLSRKSSFCQSLQLTTITLSTSSRP
jgi:hypothetical protein